MDCMVVNRIGGLLLALLCCHAAQAAASAAFMRVNQIGYATSESKRAILISTAPESGAMFSVIDSGSTTVFSGPIGSKLKKWNGTYRYVYLLDFSSVTAAGTYTLSVSGPVAAQSPAFRIDSGSSLYSSLLPNAYFFYQTQRDGPNVDPAVMSRQPSHLADASASVYNIPNFNSDGVLVGRLTQIGGPIDVSGGWLDAGDYVKFVETTSYTTAIMLTAVRDYPSLFSGGSADFESEARFGLDWLQQMWDDSQRHSLFPGGNRRRQQRSILGDHDQWSLPEADDQLNTQPGDADYFVKYRPVFRAGPRRHRDQSESCRPSRCGFRVVLPGVSRQFAVVCKPVPLCRASTSSILQTQPRVGTLLTAGAS